MTTTQLPISTSAARPAWGLLAQFDSPGAILRAARATHKAGYQRFDVHTPYPVHGMDSAMGLGRSHLGWFVAGGALVGFIVAMALQYYVTWDYPLIHQGKPFYSWQTFLVVTFELTVLFSAFSAVGAMMIINGLPQWYHPTLKSLTFASATDNRFFVSIESADKTFDAVKTRAFFEALGAISIEELED